MAFSVRARVGLSGISVGLGSPSTRAAGGAGAQAGQSAVVSGPPERQATKDPHLGLHFWVQLGQVEVAGFAECSGIQVETEVYEYAEGGLNTYTHKRPVRAKYKNITLKRGLDETKDLYSWYVKAMNGQIERQSISILVYDGKGTQVQKWDLQRAFPAKWVGPNLTTEHGAVAVETLEIAHEGLLPGK